MSETTTQARPYASAAFEQAVETGTLGDWSAMLKLLNVVVSDAGMQAVLDNPRVDEDTLTGIILDVCGEHLNEYGRNFVRTLVEADRISLAPQIFQLFEERRAAAEGTVEVEVASAYPLESAEQDRIAEAMSRRYGKKVHIKTRIDQSLIGGAVIRAGDSVIDASVRGRLRQLGNDLAD